MSGIKEPRRGYQQAGFVFPADAAAMGVDSQNAAKAFEGIFSTQYGNQNPNLFPAPPKTKKEAYTKAYAPIAENLKKSGQIAEDIFGGKNFYVDDEGNKRSRTTGKIIVDKVSEISDINKKKAEIGMPENLSLSTGKENVIDKVIEDKGKIEENPELTKKERVNTILESLGYDRAQKNALYDAMIKAGQRVSRGGLGAENLVSDIIAETSQSYDKPEKLREAANLMDVQQQLKLEQIKASKEGTGQMNQNYNYFKNRGYSDDEAARKAEGLATNLLEAKNKAIDAKLTGNKLTEYVAQQLIGIKDAYDNNTYRGTINSKDHKSVSEFVKSTDFDGAGVYTVKGRIIELDENGKILKEEIVTSSTSDKKWWNFGKDE
jgi:hypothetical protein